MITRKNETHSTFRSLLLMVGGRRAGKGTASGQEGTSVRPSVVRAVSFILFCYLLRANSLRLF